MISVLISINGRRALKRWWIYEQAALPQPAQQCLHWRMRGHAGGRCGRLGYHQAKQGTQQLFGAYQSKAGEQVLASFNPTTSESRAPLVQDAIDLDAVVLEAAAVKGILQVVKG